MDTPDNALSEIVNDLKSLILWWPKSTNVSKEFWMPDESCGICYECYSQFTIFHRKHHCRMCGLVFCAKCTTNSVPNSCADQDTYQEEGDRIRVCNSCFKQWTPGIATLDNLDLSTSPSAASLASTKSCWTVTSSSIIVGAAEPYPHATDSSDINPHPSPVLEINAQRQGVVTSNDPAENLGVSLPNQIGSGMNGNDGGDGDYGVIQLDSDLPSQAIDYYGQSVYVYKSCNLNHDGKHSELKSLSTSPLCNSPDSKSLEGTHQVEKKDCHNIVHKPTTSSPFYAAENAIGEPVDFENHQLLWLPPEAEDEGDDALLKDDDDDSGDATGESGYLSTSSSFGSGEYLNRDKFSEEQKIDMKNVVDGHLRALVAQLLHVENIPLGEQDDKNSWLEIITSLSWEAATLLKLDLGKGGGMDIGRCVKVKYIASGSRCESMMVKGVVCKKNVAHRQMTSKIEKPRLLILGGALEYQRASNPLLSFDTLLQQEMDNLKMAVEKLDAHHPDVLLVEKSVSQFAQDCLLVQNISLVLNIKRPLLERIARCTGAQIAPSIDNITSQKLGYCDMFYVESFLEDHGTTEQGGRNSVKTLMYFEGCPKPLGYTILLRGASGDELKKVKNVVKYGVFAAHHLALETCFHAEKEGSLPERRLNTPITVSLLDKPSSVDRSMSTISCGPQRSNSSPLSISSTSIHKCESTNASLSLDPSSAQVVSGSYQSHPMSEDIKNKISKTCSQTNNSGYSSMAITGDHLMGKSLGSSDETGHGICDNTPNHDTIFQTEMGSETTFSQQDVQTSLYPVSLKEEFYPSPSHHQSILVSLSSRCVWKGTVCQRFHLFRIKYYGCFDKPLGSFLKDHLFDQGYRCDSCDMPSEAHVYCYTHRQGTLTISVKKLPKDLLPGESEGKIWMWHRCMRCPRSDGFPPATRRAIMSDVAWGFSFGKFLDLSFSNHAAASGVARCGHSLHRDCLRFYGSGNIIACFRYASIDIHSVHLPPHKLVFNYENQEWIQKELNEVVDRAKLLFSETLNALILISEERAGMITLDSKRLIVNLERVLQNKKTEFEDSIQEIKKYQPVIDILEVNRLRRKLLYQSYIWNDYLIYTASLDKNLHDKLSNADAGREENSVAFNAPVIDMKVAIDQSKVLGSFDSLLADTDQEAEFDRDIDIIRKNKPVYVSSFYEAELVGRARLLLPVGVNGTVVPVYDDEPSSIIAYALMSPEYYDQLFDDVEKTKDSIQSTTSLPIFDSLKLHSVNSSDFESIRSLGSLDDSIPSLSGSGTLTLDPNSYTKSLHAQVSFTDEDPLGRVKYTVTCYYAKKFEALRRICFPSKLDFIRSFSRCKMWSAQGGKSDALFEKTLDDRFIIKGVTKTELESFIEFAPRYFRYLSESIGTGSPTCLAKIHGIYQVTIKHQKSGKESRMDVLVQENLLFGRNISRMYDLKGNARSRYNNDSSGSNKVLLDENLLEAMPTSPIFVGNQAKLLLERAIWNDTSFLSSIDVMDYSLLVGVDEEKHELVLGIIDYVRQYTWDKHLETWVKASGILGGPKNSTPTVVSPKTYKKRFRKSMASYFLTIPDQ